MNNPRKPHHLKLISGTVQPCREAPAAPRINTGGFGEPTSTAPPYELGSAPKWLPNRVAKEEWNRLGPILAAKGVLNEVNISLFGQLCSLHGKLVVAWRCDAGPRARLLSEYLTISKSFGLLPGGAALEKIDGKLDASPLR